MSSFVNLLLDGYFLGAIGIFLAIIISIVLHELAHGFVALWNGDKTAKHNGRLTINPIKHFDPMGFLMLALVGFGWAKPVPVDSRNFRKYKTGMFTVAIAGVSINLILAFVSLPLYILVKETNIVVLSELLFGFFHGMFFINLVLIVFNLLPIYPLDGFRIIESFYPNGNKYIAFMYKYGSYILLVVLVITWILAILPFVGFNLIGYIAEKIGWPIEKFWGLFGLVL